MKTLMKDEKGQLERTRKQLVDEIDGAWANLQASMEQIRRRHYYRLGELFIQLRMTFEKNQNGDKAFSAFCRGRFPVIAMSARCEYMDYRKKLGGKVTTASSIDHPLPVHLPPLRATTLPHYRESGLKGARQYKRIVDEEIDDVKPFELKPQAEEDESELVHELAEKIINTGFKILAVKLHPDKDGGSNDAMRRLNKAKKLLQDALIHVAARLI